MITERKPQQAMVLKAFLDHLESEDSSRRTDLKSERRTEYVTTRMGVCPG